MKTHHGGRCRDRRAYPTGIIGIPPIVRLEERDVFVLELDSLLGVVPLSFDGVFAYSE